jgi:hypothetical protein
VSLYAKAKGLSATVSTPVFRWEKQRGSSTAAQDDRLYRPVQHCPRRLFKKKEAAGYCNYPVNRFAVDFPYAPIRMPNGDVLYDREDCDRWIENLKTGTVDADDIVARLGQ